MCYMFNWLLKCIHHDSVCIEDFKKSTGYFENSSWNSLRNWGTIHICPFALLPKVAVIIMNAAVCPAFRP